MAPGLDDNPRMIGRMKTSRKFAVVLCLFVGGCGYAEWPPRGDGPRDVNRAPVTQAQPARNAPPAATASAFRNASAVVVGEGDTVYALSRRHGVSTRAIIEANSLEPPFHLIVGQRVELPRYPEHQVVRGDTLSAIAARYDVGIYEMARLNDLAPPYTILVGQRLRLPKAGGAVRLASKPETVQRANRELKTRATPDPRPESSPKSSPKSHTPVSPQPVRSAAPRAIPKPPPISGKGFLWPVDGRVLSSFGAKAKGFHNDGINIAAARGTAVRAAQSGVVVYAGNELRGFGNLLLIKHAGGWVTAYAHADKLLVARGDRVDKGQRIATVGSTGSVTRPQLHFEIRKGKRPRAPIKLLRRA